MKVFVLTIDHKHGSDTTLHLTRADADAALAAYCDYWWDQELDGVERPHSDADAVIVYFEKMSDREGAEITESKLGESIRDEDARVTYELWTNGFAMGFKCSQVGQPDEYIYLNPSSDSDDGTPNVFLYIGPHGDPVSDAPEHHYDIGESWG